jgi:hypothetical protein
MAHRCHQSHERHLPAFTGQAGTRGSRVAITTATMPTFDMNKVVFGTAKHSQAEAVHALCSKVGMLLQPHGLGKSCFVLLAGNQDDSSLCRPV